jgi:hypothetical protein
MALRNTGVVKDFLLRKSWPSRRHCETLFFTKAAFYAQTNVSQFETHAQD